MSELDRITLTRAQRGDAEALTALIETYGARVHALVCRMMVGKGSLALVEDLCQDALVKVVRGLAGYDPGGTARLSSWILTIATRVCIDQLRREQRRPEAELSEQELPMEGPSPESAAYRRELARRVQRAMAALSDEQRAVLVLRAYHDLDYDEIARALGIEVGTVKSRLGRARLALRRLMARSQGAA